VFTYGSSTWFLQESGRDVGLLKEEELDFVLPDWRKIKWVLLARLTALAEERLRC
jgi:hypothetical protein